MNPIENKESDLLLRLIKVYIVEYLSTVRTFLLTTDGIKCFQQEAINMLAIYILKSTAHIINPVINELSLQTKRTLALQGRTLPNCLHLVDTFEQTNIVKPIKLISFLNTQRNKMSKNIKLSFSGLQSKCENIV